MSIFLAWHNTFENKKRTFAAIGGICFSLLLVFMQLGFLVTARTTAGLAYNYFDYDLIITSARYETMMNAGSFDKTRLVQARVVRGVRDVSNLNYEVARWRDPYSKFGHGSSCMLFGFDLNPDFIPDKSVVPKLRELFSHGSVLLDIHSHEDYGEKRIGKRVSLNFVDVTIAELFELGISFHSEGAVLTGLDTFSAISKRDSRKATFGLIKVVPGMDPMNVLEELRRTLPSDVLVFERKAFIKAEQDYFTSVKPIGIMFQAGTFVAFAVGSVILFQVLSTEISNRLKEFATLKAIGFSNSYIYKVGAQQSVLFATLSFVPALPLGHLVAFLVQKASRLPMYLTWDLALFTYFLSLIMCVISGALALWKVRRADPAELF